MNIHTHYQYHIVQVPVPAAATAPAQQQQQPPTAADTATNAIDFSYEKNILKELESSSFIQDIASNGDSQQLGQSSNRTEALISQCIAAGYERKEASLALAAALSTAGDRIDGSIVAQSARDLKHLTSMGFTGGDAVGALVANRGDLQAAIDMLT